MRLIYGISFLCLWLFSNAYTQSTDSSGYAIYDKLGNQREFHTLLGHTKLIDIVLWGELHDAKTGHDLQLEFVKKMDDYRNGEIIIGMEMFESDDQLKIDEYLSGKISQKSFETEARIWSNYETDYKPIVEYAKENEIPVIATNIPRRYASMVYKKGLESLDELSKEAKKYIAPLPIVVDMTLGCYKEMLSMGMGHAGENFPNAQAVKDATMAHFILKKRDKKKLFIHFNGNYHSKDYEGINWYLRKKKKSLNILTIATVYQDDITTLEKEHIGEADFIICLENP